MLLRRPRSSTERQFVPTLWVVAALLAAVSLLGATPAVADGPVLYARDGAGTAEFKDYGDHVELCDWAVDTHSVAVHLIYESEHKGHLDYWRWNWKGGFRCKDLNLNAREGTRFFYKVCLGDHGKPGGKPADVIKGSCSRWGEAVA
jgi:hypothetical protein